MDILENRYGKASTVVVSRIPVAQWHGTIGEGTIADAILERFQKVLDFKLSFLGGVRPQQPGHYFQVMLHLLLQRLLAEPDGCFRQPKAAD
jgi:hypothetical protein